MSISKKRQHNLNLGIIGEQQAIDYLIKQDYKILANNYQHPPDQIDIIALDNLNNELVFVEVKTRSQIFTGDFTQIYTKRQLQAQTRVGEYYLSTQALKYDYRFDLIIITPDNLHHFENLTWP